MIAEVGDGVAERPFTPSFFWGGGGSSLKEKLNQTAAFIFNDQITFHLIFYTLALQANTTATWFLLNGRNFGLIKTTSISDINKMQILKKNYDL